MAKAKKYLVHFSLVVASITFLLLLIEIGVRLYWSFSPEKPANAAELFERLAKNKWATALILSDDIGGLHAAIDPYVGFVVKGGAWGVNNISLNGPDFPLKKDPEALNILLMGGSVAHLLGMSKHLERQLQAKTSQKVRLLIDANGGWIYPQYFNIFTMHAANIDAVITLEGFNEITNFLSMYSTFHELYLYANAFGERFFLDSTLAIFVFNAAKSIIARWPWLKKSYLAYEIHSRICFTIQNFIAANTELDRNGLIKRTRYPDSFSEQEALDLKFLEYQNYWRMTDAIAAQHKIKVYHFLQPIPSIAKETTPKELRAITAYTSGKIDRFTNMYKRIKSSLLELRREGIFVEDLADVFQEVKGDIYMDHIHTFEQGNILLAKRIASRIKLPTAARARAK